MINKFYLDIWSLEKKYLSELWNIIYKNILETLKKEVTSIEYKERISLLR